jgi:hypothetical protein
MDNPEKLSTQGKYNTTCAGNHHMQTNKNSINQRLSRACIIHLVIKRTNWSYVKTMSCSGSHLGITINIKKHKVCKGPSND